MAFMDSVIARSKPLWDAAADESFLRQMGEGTRPREQFLDYIIQDSLYLRDYLRAYAMAIVKARSLKEMQVFYSVLGFVNDSENLTRLQYLKDGGLTDADVETMAKKPACANYTGFLMDIAETEDVPEILMAVMPCMLGYYDVFKTLLDRYPAVLEGYYGPLVKDYTSPLYKESCDYWTAFCDELCGELPEERKERLSAIFEAASRQELYFWQMAGGKPCPHEAVAEKVPLVHCITNYVTVNDVANAILACGGSPIMADDIAEVADITGISRALVLNMGTLNTRTIASMVKAGETANEKGIPVVFDPVGAGASALRNETAATLLEKVKFTVIRGNLSEMSYLAGLSVSTRGVDVSAADLGNDPIAVGKAVAAKYGCVAAITGARDIVTDGHRVAAIGNGVPQMGKVTGTGCMLSGVIGAYVGANADPFEGTVAAITSMGMAGEAAYAASREEGTGSLRTGIIDALSRLTDREIGGKGKISYEAWD